MSLNKQDGVAWPTKIVWLGSPFPQLAVPSIEKDDLSPTMLRLCQKSFVIPR